MGRSSERALELTNCLTTERAGEAKSTSLSTLGSREGVYLTAQEQLFEDFQTQALCSGFTAQAGLCVIALPVPWRVINQMYKAQLPSSLLSDCLGDSRNQWSLS